MCRSYIQHLLFRNQAAMLSVAAACSTRMRSKREKVFHASFKILRNFATVLKVLLYSAVLQPASKILRKLK